MKIAILSRDASLYSCKRLRIAAEKKGHCVDIIDPFSCCINVDSDQSSILCDKKKLPFYDAVIPRIGSVMAFYSMSILRQFELMGSYSLNPSFSILCARDKLHTLQVLAAQDIAVPITSVAYSLDDLASAIEQVGGVPVVIKLVEGTQGIGVLLAETHQAAESMIEAFRAVNAHILIQQYIREANGRDIRCFVVGDRVVGAIERQAKAGDFRSNLHRGGIARNIHISDNEREIAIKAVKALGLDVAGVDILRSVRGPLIMEVNASPGLEGIETITKQDVAGMMMTYMEETIRLTRHQKRIG